MDKYEQLKNAVGRIGFVGAGKVGFTFGQYFKKNGYKLSGYVSAHEQSAYEAAKLTGGKAYESIDKLVNDSDTLFLTVPDGQIKDVWDYMCKLPDIETKVFCHASGSLSSDIFSGTGKTIFGFSVHPLFAISDKLTSYKELSNAVFTIEGQECKKRQMLYDMLTACGNMVCYLASDAKAMYHAAAVVASNFTVGLYDLAVKMLYECGFSGEMAAKALAPIFVNNVKNVVNRGAADALTGPVERNDVDTVRKHLQAFAKLDEGSGLDSEILTAVYKNFTKVLIGIGKEKHADYDYSEMKEVLSK